MSQSISASAAHLYRSSSRNLPARMAAIQPVPAVEVTWP